VCRVVVDGGIDCTRTLSSGRGGSRRSVSWGSWLDMLLWTLERLVGPLFHHLHMVFGFGSVLHGTGI
jgi:hypothetical protein